MDDFMAKMREYIMASENLNYPEPDEPEVLVETVVRSDTALLEAMRDVIFKLRSHMEPEIEHAFGVELGMQRAADIIEHTIRRHQHGE
jgi:hypothetical protein